MPTYVYETLPETPGGVVERFELKQGMTEAPYTVHPVSGQPVRRVISAGFAPIGARRTTETIHLSRPAGEH